MGYIAAAEVCKSPPGLVISSGTFMSRLVVLIVFVLLVGGALVYLSTVPKEVPTKTIEVAVPQGGNAH